MENEGREELRERIEDALDSCQDDTLLRIAELLDAAINGLREALRVLKALEIPILPKPLRLTPLIPNWLLRIRVRRTLTSCLGQIALGGHAATARPEMASLSREFRELIARSGVAAPTLERLFDAIER